ncbi:MAG: glycosyltransferase family 9 protein [Spirochaetota bacterium]
MLNQKSKSMLNILLIQYKPAGDVLLLTPVVKTLKKSFPDCNITFLVNEKESSVIKNYKLIDNFILLKKHSKKGLFNYINYLKYNLSVNLQIRKTRFDAVIDFIENPKSAFTAFFSGAGIRIGRKTGLRSLAYNKRIEIHENNVNTVLRRLYHLRPLGIEASYIPPEINLEERDIKFAEQYFNSIKLNNERPVIFLAPNSPRSARRWKAEYFAETARALIKTHNAKILLAWGPGEEIYTQKILSTIGFDAGMIPLTTYMEMAALFYRSVLIITNDSGPKHIANAVGVKSITIYGPTNPHVWNHIDMKNNPALRSDVTCIQCEKRECPLKRHICMENLTPDMVIKTADLLLKKS